MKVFSLRIIISLILVLGFALCALPAKAETSAQLIIEPEPKRPIYGVLNDSMTIGGEKVSSSGEEVQSANLQNWVCQAFSKYGFYNNQWSWDLATYNNGYYEITSGGNNDINPRFNRGCTKIVFASDRPGGGNYEIYAINPDGTGITRLTYATGEDYRPYWSPDGSKIVFESKRNGQQEIYTMDASGSNQVRLTNSADFDGMPNWSPDGTRIAFVSKRSGGYRIWIMDTSGGNLVALSNQPYSAYPVWSPDGSQIAYSADSNNDGWLELWTMNADGSNQQLKRIEAPGAPVDLVANTWSPDGTWFGFIRIVWVKVGSTWYWAEAVAASVPVTDWNNMGGETSTAMDMDWKPSDILAPTSSMTALPSPSTNKINLTWSGSDNGLAGILGFDVQVKNGVDGAWSTWLKSTSSTSATYNGVGGNTYYFRVRAVDQAHNYEPWRESADAFTTIEDQPPVTNLVQLPEYSRSPVKLVWSGNDPGGSGIQSYQLQVREGSTGEWQTILDNTRQASTTFEGTPGSSYYFRMRAVDNAQNTETWKSEEGDTSTSFYIWGVLGQITDNTGTPLFNALVSSLPASPESVNSDKNGNYWLRLLEAVDEYLLTVSREDYTPLPETVFPAGKTDPAFDVVLPPENNILSDWGFESGDFAAGNWVNSGLIQPEVKAQSRHTGNYGVRLSDRMNLGFSASLIPPPIYYATITDFGADRFGNIYTLWSVDVNEGVADIYLIIRRADGIWSEPELVNEGHLATYWGKLAVEGDSTVHVIWGLHYRQRDADGNWQPVEEISQSDWSVGQPPEMLVVDSNVYVCWFSQAYSYNLFCNARIGGYWEDDKNLIDDLQSSYQYASKFKMASDGEGNLHVFWRGGELITRSYVNGAWTASRIIPNTIDIYSYSLAVDPSGRMHVLFYYVDSASGGNDDKLYYLEYDPAGGWVDPELLIDGNILYSHFLASDGTLWLVWTDQMHQSPRIMYKPIGGEWSTPQAIPESFGPLVNMSLKEDGQHRLHILWLDDSWENPNAYHAVYTVGLGWSSPQWMVNSMNRLGWLIDQQDDIYGIFASIDGIYYVGPANSAQSSNSVISRTLEIPTDLSNPVLSFMYELSGASEAGGTGLTVLVDDGTTQTEVFSSRVSTTGWAHGWCDLSAWSGQTVTLVFKIHQQAGYPQVWANLDEVTLGSGYPDLVLNWLQTHLVKLPGQDISFVVFYSNQNKSLGEGSMTLSLPPEFHFVSSDPPPTSMDPEIVWELGEVPSQSEWLPVRITLQVDENAEIGTSPLAQFTILSTMPESNETNNTISVPVYVGHSLFISMVIR